MEGASQDDYMEVKTETQMGAELVLPPPMGPQLQPTPAQSLQQQSTQQQLTQQQSTQPSQPQPTQSTQPKQQSQTPKPEHPEPPFGFEGNLISYACYLHVRFARRELVFILRLSS